MKAPAVERVARAMYKAAQESTGAARPASWRSLDSVGQAVYLAEAQAAYRYFQTEIVNAERRGWLKGCSDCAGCSDCDS